MNQRPSRAAVVVIRDQQVLLIHRLKQGEEYYVIPGGWIEDGETAEQAAIREAKEELNLKVTLGRLIGPLMNEKTGQWVAYFFVTEFTGELKLGGPEKKRNSPENTYIPEWIPLAEVGTIPLVPASFQQQLLQPS